MSAPQPCQFCKVPTRQKNAAGPVCATCLKAFAHGRASGLAAAIERAKKDGATDKVIEGLQMLV
jgi:hypothetical protein